MTTTDSRSPSTRRRAADAAIGVSALVARRLTGAGRGALGLAASPLRLTGRSAALAGTAVQVVSPGLAARGRAIVDRLGEQGRGRREAATAAAGEQTRALVRRVVELALEQVDLDAVADRLDVDRVAARLDVDAVVARADLDAAVGRVDIAAVLDRVDIAAVLDRVDIDALLDRVDLDGVADRLDVDRVAARLDVDAVVARADLDRAAARLDVERFLDRVDLIGIAQEVVDGIGLPDIMRESTGSLASETVDEVRLQGMAADDAVARLTGRLRRRRPVIPAQP